MCHLMAKEERDNLARCIQKLLRATYALPDPDGLMSKLRSALDGLVALVTAPQESVVESTGGVKRHADERDEDLEGNMHHWRRSAVLSVLLACISILKFYKCNKIEKFFLKIS